MKKEFRSSKGIELHVKEVTKGKNQIYRGDKDYKLSDIDTQKNETLEQLQKCKIRRSWGSGL